MSVSALFSPEVMRVAWIIFGVLLIILEFFVPGAVIVFFGVGAVITGLAVALGLLAGLQAQFFCWVAVSLVLVLLLRGQVRRWFPALESYEPYDEGEDMRGKIVDVLRDITADSDDGRVRYQGASWKARSARGVIPAGSRAKIAGRDNLLLYVEPVQEPEAGDS